MTSQTEYPHLEIHERCLRATKNDQLWEAHAEHQGRVGPTVQSYSRKSVRAKARTAFDLQGSPRMRRFGITVTRHPRLKTERTKGPRVWQIMIRFGRKVRLP